MNACPCFKSKTRGWAEAFSRGPRAWPLHRALAQDPGEPDSHLRTCPTATQTGLMPQRLPLAEGGRSHLEVLRFVRQQLSGHRRAFLPSPPGVVGGRMGRWFLRGAGVPRAQGPALVQERLGLVSRESLVFSVLLSSRVWRRGQS